MAGTLPQAVHQPALAPHLHVPALRHVQQCLAHHVVVEPHAHELVHKLALAHVAADGQAPVVGFRVQVMKGMAGSKLRTCARMMAADGQARP